MCLTFFQPYTVAASAQIISLNITKGTITEVFKAIEDQSEYKFFYNDNQINLNKRVDVNIHEESIEQVLNNVFRGTDITYKIVKNHVVLTNKTMKDTELPSTNQNRKRLTGQVVGQDGEPLIGVNVVVKGTTIGSMTDMDGNYILENVPSNATVEFSYIGYLQQSINVGNKSNLNVTLAEDTQKLDEVVVVGYGSFKKRDLTGAVSQVKGDEISNLPLRSAADALQGKAAGVTITSSSGSPGSLGNVRIRGVGTINNNDPLYVVDGLPQGDIGWLNARDIESIEVLKDASAQAIYGARAANGVILVSTKRGASGESYRSNIEFDMNIGFQDVVKTYDMLDAEGFMEYKNRAYAASGKALIDDFATSEKREQILTFLGKNGGRSGTDWWKESTRKPKEAISQNYNLAFSGGMKKLRYRASFGYMDQQGILKGSDYERLSGRLNVDSEVTKWLNLSANVNVTYESRRNLDENNSYTATVFSTLAADPITPVYRDNLVDIPDFLQNRIMGGYEPTNPWSRYTGVIYSNKPNTVGQVDRSALNQWHGIATKSNISGEVKLLPFLTFKSSIALDLVRNQSDSFRPSYYLDGDEYSTYAGASRSVANKDYWVFDNYLTYNQKFDKHAVTAMVGTSAEKERYEEIYAYKEGQVNNNPNQQIINAGTMNPAASGYYATSTLNSYFGRVFYSFDNRYMITANIRWDGSSKFADGNRWGYFPSFSAGWVMSNESWMENTKNWMDFLKVRASWGQNGNENIGAYKYASTYAFGDLGLYSFNNNKNGGTQGAYPSLLPNNEITWETSEQTNVGLDARFLNGRLNANFDWYSKKTKDLLIDVPVSSINGFSSMVANAGTVKNTGIELALNWRDEVGSDFSYGIGLNLAHNKNEVTEVNNGTHYVNGGNALLSEGTTYMARMEEGHPIGYFWGYKTDGVMQNQADIQTYLDQNCGGDASNSLQGTSIAPGDLKFVDVNGDGVINDSDKTEIGNPHPDLTMGLNLDFSWKGFDLNISTYGAFGMQVAHTYRKFGNGQFDNYSSNVYNYWHGEGTSNRYPILLPGNTVNHINISDIYVDDADYFRIQNVTLGYDIKRLWKSCKFQQLRLYVSAQNLFTFTGYKGMDPECGTALNDKESWVTGVDVGNYPQARTYMVGVNVKF